MSHRPRQLIILAFCALLAPLLSAQSFVNWESPHVHPLDRTPDGVWLLAVNTPDNRVEVLDLSHPIPVLSASIPVGLDPVTARALDDSTAWVVNHLSDSISVVDLVGRGVVRTVTVCDEPADVVFAVGRAFVSCSQRPEMWVLDPAQLDAAPIVLPLQSQAPRALAVSADGGKVLAAVFESGNGSTILGTGMVSHSDGPYGGQNPPPNAGAGFVPPKKPEYLQNGEDPAPPNPLIVRQGAAGDWLDDNGGDWTDFISGSQSALTGRPPGWTLLDRDVAVIDASTLDVQWVDRAMNLNMAIGVNPATGVVTVVGTEALNEVRFEPNLKSHFVRVNMASMAASAGVPSAIVDLNAGHLSYDAAQIATQADPTTASQALRDLSIGDPRAIVWRSDGARGWVAGMGSNNVTAIHPSGTRADAPGNRGGSAPPIEVGEGPTGLVLDVGEARLYVLNKFSSSISVVDLATETSIIELSFYDPSPDAIRDGRPLLYDTHLTSGLGQASCASCHPDARMDRLVWNLGDPQGEMKAINGTPGQHNLGMNVPPFNQNFEDFHPMKGPMVTQTLQGIIGMEPLHWRGDRDGLEEFNGAFTGLLGDDTQLDAEEMERFERFVETVTFPPNPFRNLDNSLPTDLPLPELFSDGRFAGEGGLQPGEPLPNGNAESGLALYRPPNLLDLGFPCITCHALPTGAGADVTLNISTLEFEFLPPGPMGERHLALVAGDGTTQNAMKIPHLRNMHEKMGYEKLKVQATAGFGYANDGTIDSIARFIGSPVFAFNNDQEVADMVAFMLAFSGSDLPEGSTNALDLEPPGPPSADTHAAVGVQLTLTVQNRDEPPTLDRLAELEALADAAVVGLVVKGRVGGLARGYMYLGAGQLQSDRESEMTSMESLRQGVVAGGELTVTLVPEGSQERIGVDRDEDGAYDRDELDACSNPANPLSLPDSGGCGLFRDDFERGTTDLWSLTQG